MKRQKLPLLEPARAHLVDILRTVDLESELRRLMLLQNLTLGPQGAWFGSRSLPADSPECLWATAVGEILAERGWVLKTGLGPGTMAAPHKGYHNLGKRHLAVGIKGAFLQHEPPHEFADIRLQMPTFQLRIEGLIMGSSFIIVQPGRLGTFHELFDLLDMIKHGLMPGISVWLVDVDDYYQGFVDFMTKPVSKNLGPRISPKDLEQVHIISLNTDPAAFVDMLEADVRNVSPHKALGRTQRIPLGSDVTEEQVAAIIVRAGRDGSVGEHDGQRCLIFPAVRSEEVIRAMTDELFALCETILHLKGGRRSRVPVAPEFPDESLHEVLRRLRELGASPFIRRTGDDWSYIQLGSRRWISYPPWCARVS